MSKRVRESPEELVKKSIPQLPFRGVRFYDINGCFKDPAAFRAAVDSMLAHYRPKQGEIDAIAAMDARGFPFGAVLAYEMGLSWFMIRKENKLPGDCHVVRYKTEYSEDTVACQKQSFAPGARILIIDDLLATGGTARAASELILSLGGRPIQLGCIIELPFLKGREKMGIPVWSLIKYESE